MLAVSRAPVEVRARYPARRPDETDLLAPLHGVPHRHERLRQVEVSGDHAAAVIDVHDVPGEKEIVHQGDDAPVCRPY